MRKKPCSKTVSMLNAFAVHETETDPPPYRNTPFRSLANKYLDVKDFLAQLASSVEPQMVRTNIKNSRFPITPSSSGINAGGCRISPSTRIAMSIIKTTRGASCSDAQN